MDAWKGFGKEDMLKNYIYKQIHYNNEPRHEKTNGLVSDMVRHKPGCTATEDGSRLEISDLESRGIVLSV